MAVARGDKQLFLTLPCLPNQRLMVSLCRLRALREVARGVRTPDLIRCEEEDTQAQACAKIWFGASIAVPSA